MKKLKESLEKQEKEDLKDHAERHQFISENSKNVLDNSTFKIKFGNGKKVSLVKILLAQK